MYDKLETGGRIKPWQAQQFLYAAWKKRASQPCLHIQCLVCSRRIDTFFQRVWHRLLCWKKHPKQAGRIPKR